MATHQDEFDEYPLDDEDEDDEEEEDVPMDARPLSYGEWQSALQAECQQMGRLGVLSRIPLICLRTAWVNGCAPTAAGLAAQLVSPDVPNFILETPLES